MCRIGVVIVTYNRKEKLRKAIQCYEEQEYKPRFIVVVDNNSTDGTKEFLLDWSKNKGIIDKKAIYLKKNSGGSGGYFEGLKVAQMMPADWIWVADDDAYPNKKCLQILVTYLKHNDNRRIAAICATVLTNGNIDTWHRRRFQNKYGCLLIEQQIKEQEYEKEYFELDLFSYVGTLIQCRVLKKIGLPQKNFFISYDDSEHSIRIRKCGKIICVPEAKVIHDSDDIQELCVTWKKYYNLRNKLYSYRIHFGTLQFVVYALYYSFKNRKNRILYKMTREAIRDAQRGILGVNRTYGPGWKGEIE